jgi:uncharacterized protein (TIGR03435 family)
MMTRQLTRRRILIGLAIASMCATAAARGAQQPAPKFEVVSIRPLPPNAPPTMRAADFTPFLPGGRYINENNTLVSLIATAYQVKYPDNRLLGLPAWKTTRYAVSAKAADDFPRLSPADNEAQVRLMLREMLADRFRLRLHTETREETVLKMTVDRGGILVKEVAAPVPPETEGRVNTALSDRGGRIIGTKATMAGIATVAGLWLRHEVIDDTGLKGYYDFDIRWTAPPDPNRPSPSPQLGADGIALFQSMLKEQFGLSFSRETGPVQYWVVDQVEPPTAD